MVTQTFIPKAETITNFSLGMCLWEEETIIHFRHSMEANMEEWETLSTVSGQWLQPHNQFNICMTLGMFNTLERVQLKQ